MITGRAKRSIEDYFDRSFELEQLLKARGKNELHDMVVGISNLAEILYVRQREPLGLGHAVLCGEPFCRGEYFGVVLPDDVFVGDVPVMSQLIDVHKRLGGTVVALERVPRGDVSRYGIVRSEEVEGGVHRILDMVEKPPVDEAPGEYAIMGRYVTGNSRSVAVCLGGAGLLFRVSGVGVPDDLVFGRLGQYRGADFISAVDGSAADCDCPFG